MPRKLISTKDKHKIRCIDRNRFLTRTRYRVERYESVHEEQVLFLVKRAWDLKYYLEKTKKVFGDNCPTVKVYKRLIQENDNTINKLLGLI
jgi:hypothetical protein